MTQRKEKEQLQLCVSNKYIMSLIVTLYKDLGWTKNIVLNMAIHTILFVPKSHIDVSFQIPISFKNILKLSCISNARAVQLMESQMSNISIIAPSEKEK